MALDTYFRGNSHELEFCQKVSAGGNHLVVATAGGQTLGKEGLKLRKSDLQAVLGEYARVPKEHRRPTLDDPAKAQPPKRAVPQPPPNGLIIRGYCTYLRQDEKQHIVRSKEYYYKADPKPGGRREVAPAIQKRFYSTIGIDYMEGSVNSLPSRKTTMTLTVQRADNDTIVFRLDGYAHLGKEFDEKLRSEANSRGCEVRVLGDLRYDRKKEAIIQFDIVGIGKAWGNKMEYIHREIRLDQYPWTYGIAWELVTGDTPQDRIPPYNLLHYNSTGPYFDKP